LLQRNPEDYLAKQRAQETEDRTGKPRHQRRPGNKGRDLEVESRRRSYNVPKTDEDFLKAREERRKRRSLNLDKRGDNSDKSSSENPAVNSGKSSGSSRDSKAGTKATDGPLSVATDSTDGFTPESASSPRTDSVETQESPRSPGGGPVSSRPSTKRKVAPPPPCNFGEHSAPAAVDITPVVSPRSKIPKPVSQTEKEESKKSAKESKGNNEANVTLTPTAKQSNCSKTETVKSEPVAPARPARRKKSVENKSFLHGSIHSEKAQESSEIKNNLKPNENTSTIEIVTKSDITEKSLLDEVFNELPNLNKGVEEEIQQVKTVQVEQSIPVKKTVTFNGELETEIQPVKIQKSRGLLDETEVSGTITLVERKPVAAIFNDVDSDDDKKIVIPFNTERKVSMDYMNEVEEIQSVRLQKSAENDVDNAFDRILTFPDRVKDTRDTISIASDISSAGSEAPPLPESAPPSLTSNLTLNSDSGEGQSNMADIEVIQALKVESTHSAPAMDSIPELSVRAKPRELTSPIDELKASMFSMRVTSPTRQMNGDVKGQHDDSDVSDDEQQQNGSFTPGMFYGLPLINASQNFF